MFENMVECAKNKRQSKNRWAFFAATSLVWTLMLTGVIVGGIFLYDAHLDEQYAVIAMIAPVPPPPPPPRGNPATKPNTSAKSAAPTLPPDMTPPKPPTEITTPTAKPVSLVSTDTLKGAGDMNIGDPNGSENGVTGGIIGGIDNGTNTNAAPKPQPPAPPVVEEVKPQIPPTIRRSEGVIRGLTRTQVKPDYPVIARSTHVSGDVLVEITIGEDGNVISAHVVNGPPLLQQAALNAAKQWKFNPTLLNNTAVKVTGVLTFRFTL